MFLAGFDSLLFGFLLSNLNSLVCLEALRLQNYLILMLAELFWLLHGSRKVAGSLLLVRLVNIWRRSSH